MMTTNNTTMQAGKSRRSEGTPWRAEGREVLDCDGQVVAVAGNEDDARLMAQAPRMEAVLGGLADYRSRSTDAAFAFEVKCPWFWQDVLSTLEDAGHDTDELEVPVHGTLTPIERADCALHMLIYASNEFYQVARLSPSAEPLFPQDVSGKLRECWQAEASAFNDMNDFFRVAKKYWANELKAAGDM